MPLRANFNTSNIINPFDSLQKGLAAASGTLTTASDRNLKKKELAAQQARADRQYALQKATADRNASEYAYKVGQREAIPGLVQGDIVNKDAAAYTADFNRQLAAKTSSADDAWKKVMGSQQHLAAPTADSSAADRLAYKQYTDTKTKADAAYDVEAKKGGYGGDFVNKFSMPSIEQGMGTSLLEEYNIRKSNASAANNLPALAAIESDLGARVKAQDASIASGKKQADAVALAEFNQRSKAAQKTISKGRAGTKSGSGKGTFSSKYAQPDAELFAEVDATTWFRDNDDARNKLKAAALVGMSAKDQRGMWTVSSSTGMFDAFDDTSIIPAKVTQVADLLAKGKSPEEIEAMGIKLAKAGKGGKPGTPGTTAKDALQNQDALNKKYREQLAANSEMFQAPSRDVAGLQQQLSADFAGVKATPVVTNAGTTTAFKTSPAIATAMSSSKSGEVAKLLTADSAEFSKQYARLPEAEKSRVDQVLQSAGSQKVLTEAGKGFRANEVVPAPRGASVPTGAVEPVYKPGISVDSYSDPVKFYEAKGQYEADVAANRYTLPAGVRGTLSNVQKSLTEPGYFASNLKTATVPDAADIFNTIMQGNPTKAQAQARARKTPVTQSRFSTMSKKEQYELYKKLNPEKSESSTSFGRKSEAARYKAMEALVEQTQSRLDNY